MKHLRQILAAAAVGLITATSGGFATAATGVTATGVTATGVTAASPHHAPTQIVCRGRAVLGVPAGWGQPDICQRSTSPYVFYATTGPAFYYGCPVQPGGPTHHAHPRYVPSSVTVYARSTAPKHATEVQLGDGTVAYRKSLGCRQHHDLVCSERLVVPSQDAGFLLVVGGVGARLRLTRIADRLHLLPTGETTVPPLEVRLHRTVTGIEAAGLVADVSRKAHRPVSLQLSPRTGTVVDLGSTVRVEETH